MTPRAIWADHVYTDVADIWFTIAFENSPVVADGMLANIYGALDLLAVNPMIGSRRAR